MISNKKTLLIIGAGREQIPGIQLAKGMGLYVVATDGNPHAPGFAFADDYGLVSTYDVKGTVIFAARFNKKRKIVGVLTLAADVPLTVAAVAKELNLPGNSLKTASLASNKLEMKIRFKQNGIPIPWFKEIRNLSELKNIIKRRGYPMVIKPLDNRGARGVLLLKEGIDLKWAYENSLANSFSGRVMAEEFLEGLQVSTESIIYDGKIFTPGLSNRNYEYLERFAPYIIENGGDLPVKLNATQKEEVNIILKQAAKSLDIKRGVLKGDVVWTKEGPKIIEVAARLSGGWLSTHEVPLSTGVNIVKAAIEISLGQKPDFNELISKYQKGVALRYLFPLLGVVKKVSGLGQVRRKNWVKEMQIFVKPGDLVEEITNHTKRAGFVICVGKTRREAIKQAKKAIKKIKIETETRCL